MSLTATARSIPGTLRQEVVIDHRHRLITDEPAGFEFAERIERTRERRLELIAGGRS
jgi:hypothetical protein